MRRKKDLVLLKKIAAIRDLQRIAAEAQTVRAAAALREKAEALTEKEHAQRSAEADWLAFLTAPSLRVEMLPFWSGALLRQCETVRHASDVVDGAKSEMKERTVSWHAAEKRSDNALESARRATKERARNREEAALQEASERHSQKRIAR